MPNQSNTNKQPVSFEFSKPRHPNAGEIIWTGTKLIAISRDFCNIKFPVLTPIYDKEPESEDEAPFGGAPEAYSPEEAEVWLAGYGECFDNVREVWRQADVIRKGNIPADELAQAVRVAITPSGRLRLNMAKGHRIATALKAYDESQRRERMDKLVKEAPPFFEPQPEQPKEQRLSDVVESVLNVVEGGHRPTWGEIDGGEYGYLNRLKAALARQKIHDEAVVELVGAIGWYRNQVLVGNNPESMESARDLIDKAIEAVEKV